MMEALKYRQVVRMHAGQLLTDFHTVLSILAIFHLNLVESEKGNVSLRGQDHFGVEFRRS